MKMTCPHCGVVGSAHGSMPGEKVRCPQCDKVFKLMEQKLACPHCGIIGSLRDSVPGTKFRCPRCAKVFLLMPEMLAEKPARGAAVADVSGAMAAPAAGIEPAARAEWVSPVAEPELIPESLTGVLPEVALELEPPVLPEAEVVPEPEPELLPEAEVVLEPEPELLPEAEVVLEPEPEVLPEAEVIPEPEPVTEPAGRVAAELGEVVFESVVEPAAELCVEPAVEPEEVPQAEAGAEGLEPAGMPTDVCAGCGDSFHPEFLQEIDAKLYCGVCQLRAAAMDAGQQTAKYGGRKLWGMLAALVLLGLLVLVVLVLMKLGII
ncbi:MAG: hypothetical protein K0A99_03855 [Desulfoarculaceae bacterium]|nr:hypothetical protein [Desulfoarculaceae bacterium]